MTTREQYEDWFRAEYGQEPMPRTSHAYDFCWAGYKAGRQAERVVTIKDDDDLRFIKRVLEGNNPAEKDKERCLQLIHEIRSRARSTHGAEAISEYQELKPGAKEEADAWASMRRTNI